MRYIPERVARSIKKYPFFCILIFLFHPGLSRLSFSQDCECKLNLDAIIKGIEKNYAGFNDKVSRKNRSAYDLEKSILLKNANKLALNYDCLKLIFRYLFFFDDPHVSLQRIPDNKESILFWKTIFTGSKKIDYATSSMKLSKKLLPAKPSIEGIWINEGRTLKVNLQRVGENVYEAIRINPDNVLWFDGQIKFKFNIKSNKALFYNTYHIPRNTSISISNSIISLGKYGRFMKWDGTVKKEGASNMFWFRQYSDSILYIKFGSFDPKYFKAIDSMLNSASAVLEKSKYFLIDFTDNTGGSTSGFDRLIHYFIDSSYIEYGEKVRPSETNLNYYQKISVDTLFPEYVRLYAKNISQKMKENMNSPLSEVVSDSIIKNRGSIISAKKAFFLVNSRTTSAAEGIFQIVRQSDRCKIAGQKTAGLVDYGNVNLEYNLPCKFIKLGYPTNRSNINDLPGHISNNGIIPDIILDMSIDEWANVIIQKYITKEK